MRKMNFAHLRMIGHRPEFMSAGIDRAQPWSEGGAGALRNMNKDDRVIVANNHPVPRLSGYPIAQRSRLATASPLAGECYNLTGLAELGHRWTRTRSLPNHGEA